MIENSDLNAFVVIVQAGSFTRAAEKLSTQKAHLSRVVSRLEGELQVRLLQRSTRSLALTEEGREFLERAVGILSAVKDTERALADFRAEPQGTLRISCGVEFGVVAVHGWIASYLQKYPQVRAEVDLTNRLVDIVHEGIDVAIRVGVLPDSGLSARKLGDIDYQLYASREYVQMFGQPGSPIELVNHSIVSFAPASPLKTTKTFELVNGKERVEVKLTPRLFVNNHMAARDAAAASLGIALLPRLQARTIESSAQLVPILKGWTRRPTPVHAVFASNRYLAPKVRAFVDLAIEAFAKTRRELDLVKLA